MDQISHRRFNSSIRKLFTREKDALVNPPKVEKYIVFLIHKSISQLQLLVKLRLDDQLSSPPSAETISHKSRKISSTQKRPSAAA